MEMNMKRVLIAVALCLATAVPSQAHEFVKRLTAQIGAGAAFPVGVTNDHAGTGFNFIATAGPRISRKFSLVVDFSLQDSLDVDVFRNGSADRPIDANLRMWSITLDPVYEFVREERTTVYAT